MTGQQLAEAAAFLRRDLERRRLRVSLAPAPEPRHGGHFIRVVEERNPRWYRQLCDRHLKVRSRRRRRRAKFVDTAIKRGHVLRALQQFERGTPPRSIYAERLWPFLEDCARWLADPQPDFDLFAD